MTQKINGEFDLKLNGVPGLASGDLSLTSKRGKRVRGRALIIGPFVIGSISRKG